MDGNRKEGKKRGADLAWELPRYDALYVNVVTSTFPASNTRSEDLPFAT
jgi:hypothetical protein